MPRHYKSVVCSSTWLEWFYILNPVLATLFVTILKGAHLHGLNGFIY